MSTKEKLFCGFALVFCFSIITWALIAAANAKDVEGASGEMLIYGISQQDSGHNSRYSFLLKNGDHFIPCDNPWKYELGNVGYRHLDYKFYLIAKDQSEKIVWKEYVRTPGGSTRMEIDVYLHDLKGF